MPHPPVPDENLGASADRPPCHGFRGVPATDVERRAPSAERPGPLAPTIALSRESGARGGTIGRRVGRKLGWQVYDQELLEYVAQETDARQGLTEYLPRPAVEWAEARLAWLLREQNLSAHPVVVNLARVVLALAARGGVVLIGRGAGCILPPESTLNVRVIAPLPDRIAYLGQWLRLTEEEAAERVRQDDARRAEFITTHFHRDPADAHQYDLLLNVGLLGEDACVELIAHAMQARTGQRSDLLPEGARHDP